MKVKFWGVRGSIPSPLGNQEVRHKIHKALRLAKNVDLDDAADVERFIDTLPALTRGTVGGNTACVEVRAGDGLIILDSGSGIRELGQHLMHHEFARGAGVANLFLSHTHWDHIMGFPFFTPAYMPGNVINIFACHDQIESRMNDQHGPEHFPVTLDAMAAKKKFTKLTPGEPHRMGNEMVVTPFELWHPGGSYGYRLEHRGKVLVYASDTEFKQTGENDTWHLRDADLLILDTMYTFDELVNKTDWGHCTPFIGVDICLRENVKRLALFHHEPVHDDEEMEEVLKKTKRYLKSESPKSNLEIVLSVEGLELSL